MAQTLGDKQVFSLYEVARSVRTTLQKRYKTQYWVRGEMNKLNYYPQSGHCFPELLEKKEGKIIAEFSAVIWKQDYQRIARQFKVATQENLKDGMELLFLAQIIYDEVYGISLHIKDIDAGFTLGVLQQERLASIAYLQEAGIFDRNKQLDFPLVPKRIAVISVDTSKGLADFYQILKDNPWKYHFECTLFPALLQGDKAVHSIIGQLKNIAANLQDYDLVAIIRGGGADVGLSAYNNCELSREIACFPLPVLAGIGHATNQTVSELVAFKSAVTPSALADFLLQHFHTFASGVEQAEQVLKIDTLTLIHQHQERLDQALRQYVIGSGYLLNRHKDQVDVWSEQLEYKVKMYLEKQGLVLDQLEDKVQLIHPLNALKRGFSIIRMNGAVVRSTDQLQAGAEITAQLFDGTFTGTVNDIGEKHE